MGTYNPQMRAGWLQVTPGSVLLKACRDPLTRERHLGDLGHGHDLGRQQHHLGPPPGHHRLGAPADGLQQARLVNVFVNQAGGFGAVETEPNRSGVRAGGVAAEAGMSG
ncbi:hypothetical protein ACWD62_33715 [Streptomyces sp. NPDC005146]